MKLLLQPIPELPQEHEIFPGIFRIGRQRRDGHQPLNLNSLRASYPFELREKPFRPKPEFRGFSGNVYLQQDTGKQTEIRGNSLNLLQKFNGIDAVEHLEKRQCLADLIALQVTN